MGALSLVLNQTSSRARVEQASRAASLWSFVARPSTKRDRAGVAVPPKSHGAARQLTMGRRALHTLIISRIIPARHAAWMCTYAAFTPSTGTVPRVDSQRKGSRPTHRSFSSHTHKRGSCARYIQLADIHVYSLLKAHPALAISVLGSRYMCARTYNHLYALCIFTHTGLLCPASCSYRRGDAEAMHFHPRHLASRITLLHLARRPISPIRHPRRPPRLASPATTHATARSTVALCVRLGHRLLLSLPDHCTYV